MSQQLHEADFYLKGAFVQGKTVYCACMHAAMHIIDVQFFPTVNLSGLGPRHYTVHLRAVLLLQFMEHLDKLMYNAYEGSCVTLPLVPKAVKGFFRKNMDVCLSWLSNVRGYLVSVATHAGLPAVALRHGFAALQNLMRTSRNAVIQVHVCVWV